LAIIYISDSRLQTNYRYTFMGKKAHLVSYAHVQYSKSLTLVLDIHTGVIVTW